MKKEVWVSPSIAAANLLEIGNEVRKLETSGANSIHFDVMDGHFVPHVTIGVPFLAQMRKITAMHLDVHIMVTNPDSSFQHYLTAGADTLTFQQEASLHPHRLCQKIKEHGKKAGIALNPGTHWNSIEYLLPILDQVTVMSVDPGFSGQKHIPHVHTKISALAEFKHKHKLNFNIAVDGGVTQENFTTLTKLGADILIMGSAFFVNPNYQETVNQLRKLK